MLTLSRFLRVSEEPDLTDIGITKLYSEQGEYLDDTRIRLFYQVSDASATSAPLQSSVPPVLP